MKQPLPRRQKIYWPDNTCYFLTTSTFLHYPYFKEDKQKQIILDKIKQIKQLLSIPMFAFSISINHFHLKFYLEKGKLMKQLKIILHGGVSREYRKIYKVSYKEFWSSSRTYFIKDQETSWKITGYTIGNLLKHREVSTFKELEANPFSSYRYTVEKFGEETAQELVRGVIDVSEDAEGIVDIKELEEPKTKPPRF